MVISPLPGKALPLAAPLQAILDAELAAGNTVAEVSAWSPRCELLVLLRQPFARQYSPAPGLSYRLLNDPHYWLAEYAYAEGRQVLGCHFASS